MAAGILSAPWQALWPAGLLLGLAGLAGVTYMLIVLWLARHRLDYQPVLSDWLWYTVLPLVSYAALVVAPIVLPSQPVPALFVIAALSVFVLVEKIIPRGFSLAKAAGLLLVGWGGWMAFSGGA